MLNTMYWPLILYYELLHCSLYQNKFNLQYGLKKFTAKETAIYSNAESPKFWHLVFFKHSNSKLMLLAKHLIFYLLAISENHPSSFFSNFEKNRFKTWNVINVGLKDHFPNIAPVFASEWLAQAFHDLFWFPSYILTHCGIYFFILLLRENATSSYCNLKILSQLRINFMKT